MRKIVYVVYFIVIVYAVNGQPDTKELLENYRASLLPLNRISSKIKSTKQIKSHANPIATEEVQFEEIIFRTDGKKCEWIGKAWTTDLNNKKLYDDRPIYELYDENRFVLLDRDHPYPERNFYQAAIYKKDSDKKNEKRLEHPNYAGPMNGRMYGSTGKSVADLLSDSKGCQIRKELEVINGIDCYVIEGYSQYGKVIAWIAPSKGYNAVRWSIEKNKDSFFNNEKLHSSIKKWTVTFEANSFQQIDEIYLTESGVLNFELIFDSGQVELTEYRYNRTEVDLNPDFVALNAFKLNLPEDTRVSIADIPSISYIWRNGKLEADKILDSIIDAQTAELDLIHEGKGTAEIKITNPKDTLTREGQVNFWFKREKTRSDLWQDKDGTITFMSSDCYNGKLLIRYNDKVPSANIRKAGRGAFRQQYGQDFHPSVFFNIFDGRSFKDLFGYFRKTFPEQIYFQNQDDGLIKVGIKLSEIKKYGSKEYNASSDYYVIVDPQIGFRIVEYYFEDLNGGGPDAKVVEKVKMEWKRYGQSIFPKNINFDSSFALPARDLFSERHFHVQIIEFSGDVQITDEIFSLEGMPVKNGTLIDDRINGTTYRYGDSSIQRKSENIQECKE